MQLSFNDNLLRAEMDKRLEFIYANREKLCEAFIAETGLKPSECELVVEDRGMNMTATWARKKPCVQISADSITCHDPDVKHVLLKMDGA